MGRWCSFGRGMWDAVEHTLCHDCTLQLPHAYVLDLIGTCLDEQAEAFQPYLEIS